MIARIRHTGFISLSVTALLIAARACPAEVYQDLDFSVSLSPSWDGHNGWLRADARWVAPAKWVSSYGLYLDGRFSKYAAGNSTFVIAPAMIGSHYSSYAKFMEKVEAYLSRPHTYKLEARLQSGATIYDIYEYHPPQVLTIVSRMAGGADGGDGSLQIVHKQDAAEGLDHHDSPYGSGSKPQQMKIVSVLSDTDPGSPAELALDARPLASTTDVCLELSLVSLAGDPVVLSSPQSHDLVFGLPGQAYDNDFGPKPITIQQYDPLDSSADFPVYDVRKVVEKWAGVLALPDLKGSYSSSVPYAWFRLSFAREVSGDLDGNRQLDMRDFAILANAWHRTDGVSACDIAGHWGLGLPDGHVNSFDLMAFCQSWAGVGRDGFESGDFEALRWLLSGFPFWKVVSSQSRSGLHCAQAGPIDDGGRTALIISIPCRAGQVSFWRKVSSENNGDVLRFSIDRHIKAEWSGQLGWERVSFPIEAGVRTLSWEYSKDDASASGQDTAWIDDVLLPVP